MAYVTGTTGLSASEHESLRALGDRIAFLYEDIAMALTEASALASAEGAEADWKDQEGRIWEQARAFWARCVRGCSMGGAYLDAWDLRCGHGLANSQAKLDASSPARQAN